MNYCLQQNSFSANTECCLFQRNVTSEKNVFRPFLQNAKTSRHSNKQQSIKVKNLKIVNRKKDKKTQGEIKQKKKISITKTNQRSRSIQNTTKPFGSFQQTLKNSKNTQQQRSTLSNLMPKQGPQSERSLNDYNEQTYKLKIVHHPQHYPAVNPCSSYHPFIKPAPPKEEGLKNNLVRKQQHLNSGAILPPTDDPSIIRESSREHFSKIESSKHQESESKKNESSDKHSFVVSRATGKQPSLQASVKGKYIQSLEKMNQRSVRSVYENSEAEMKKVEQSIILLNFFNPSESQRKSIEQDMERRKVYFSTHMA